MVQKDDVDSQSVAIVGIFGAVLVFVLILAIQVLYYRIEKKDDYVKFVLPGSTPVKTMIQEQRAELAAYNWVDRQKETVTIPIERAMDLVVRELQAQKP